jgi:hypothetical protein
MPALLPTREDPAALTAQAARETYVTMWQETHRRRMRGEISDLETVRRIDTAWREASEAIAAAYADLTARRRARVAELEATLDLTPGVPEGTSPADAAVLHGEFRRLLEDARALTVLGARAAAMREAMRFGDDLRIRALIVAAFDESDAATIDAWTAGSPGKAEALEEWRYLNALLDGATFDAMWDTQLFAQLRQPDESKARPQWEAVAAITDHAHRRHAERALAKLQDVIPAPESGFRRIG